MSQLPFTSEVVKLNRKCQDDKTNIGHVSDLTGRVKQKQNCKGKDDDDGYLNNFITQLLAVDYVKIKCSRNDEKEHPGLCEENEEVPSDEHRTKKARRQNKTDTSGRRGTIVNSESKIESVSVDANNVYDADFIRSNDLKEHTKIQTKMKPYKCDVCGVGFAQSGDLNRHKIIHTGEKPYHCDVCGRRFAHNSNLRRHKRIHTGEKPFKCDVCSLAFAKNSDLKRHSSLHTGEKPYKCDVCGVGFSKSYHMERHKRMHMGDKPYKCDVCGVGFAHKNPLNVHKRMHT